MNAVRIGLFWRICVSCPPSLKLFSSEVKCQKSESLVYLCDQISVMIQWFHSFLWPKLHPFFPCKISPTLPWTLTATCMKRSETDACTRTSCLPPFLSPRPCLTTDSQIKGAAGDHQHALRFVQTKSCQLRAVWFEACFALIAALTKQSVDRADAVLLQLRCNLLSQQVAARVRDPTDVGQLRKDSDLPFELRGELV